MDENFTVCLWKFWPQNFWYFSENCDKNLLGSLFSTHSALELFHNSICYVNLCFIISANVNVVNIGGD